MIGSDRNSSSSNRLWLSLIPARMKKIRFNIMTLEWSQKFCHHKSMQILKTLKGSQVHILCSNLAEFRTYPSFLWLSSFPARIRKIRSNIKALELSQHFPHYNPMGGICCHVNRSKFPFWFKFEGGSRVLIVPVPGHYILVPLFDPIWPKT